MQPPLEDGKRMLDRTTLAFLAMAVSRLDRGTAPALAAGAPGTGFKASRGFTYSRALGHALKDGGIWTVLDGPSHPSFTFP